MWELAALSEQELGIYNAEGSTVQTISGKVTKEPRNMYQSMSLGTLYLEGIIYMAPEILGAKKGEKESRQAEHGNETRMRERIVYGT